MAKKYININSLPRNLKGIADTRYQIYQSRFKTKGDYNLNTGFSWEDTPEGDGWWRIIYSILGINYEYKILELEYLSLYDLQTLQIKLIEKSDKTYYSELWRPFTKELEYIIKLKSSPKNSLELALKNKFKIL